MGYKHEDALKAVKRLENGERIEMGYGLIESYVTRDGDYSYFSDFTGEDWHDAELAIMDTLELMVMAAKKEGKKVWLK